MTDTEQTPKAAPQLTVGSAVWLRDDEDRECRGTVSRPRRSSPEPPDEGMVYVRWWSTGFALSPCFAWEYAAELVTDGAGHESDRPR